MSHDRDQRNINRVPDPYKNFTHGMKKIGEGTLDVGGGTLGAAGAGALMLAGSSGPQALLFYLSGLGFAVGGFGVLSAGKAVYGAGKIGYGATEATLGAAYRGVESLGYDKDVNFIEKLATQRMMDSKIFKDKEFIDTDTRTQIERTVKTASEKLAREHKKITPAALTAAAKEGWSRNQ